MPSIEERNAGVDALRKAGYMTENNAVLLHLVDVILPAAERVRTPPAHVDWLTLVWQNWSTIEDIVSKLGGMQKIASVVPELFQIVQAAVNNAKAAADRGQDPTQALATFRARSTAHSGE